MYVGAVNIHVLDQQVCGIGYRDRRLLYISQVKIKLTRIIYISRLRY